MIQFFYTRRALLLQRISRYYESLYRVYPLPDNIHYVQYMYNAIV